MTVEFKQYVRNRQNRRRGVFSVKLDGHMASVGWSLCSKSDKFEREFGLRVANERRDKKRFMTFPLVAKGGYDRDGCQNMARFHIPESMKNDFDQVIDRLNRIRAKSLEPTTV